MNRFVDGEFRAGIVLGCAVGRKDKIFINRGYGIIKLVAIGVEISRKDTLCKLLQARADGFLDDGTDIGTRGVINPCTDVAFFFTCKKIKALKECLQRRKEE